MPPVHHMLTAPWVAREAALADARNAVSAARCAARVAGEATAEFAVRELLLCVIAELERAERALRRLGI